MDACRAIAEQVQQAYSSQIKSMKPCLNVIYTQLGLVIQIY